MITKEETELKLCEIIPLPSHLKRGLFNAVTGNLDSSDGERYENLINIVILLKSCIAFL